MAFNPGLNPGDVIDNSQLADIFKCAPQGGMRRAHKTGTLVIVSDHTRAIYEDRWIEDVLHYTGMGQVGDQSINSSQNKTLNESSSNGVEVYLFEVFKKKEYTFMGQVELAGEPYQEDQTDKNNDMRKVWVFPLKLVSDKRVILSAETIKVKQEKKRKEAENLDDETLLKRARQSKKGTGTRTVSTTTYERNVYVSELAKRRANGICQLCEEAAPFIDKKGRPYLETHHIIWLSKGGEDTIENTAALCPNCHRKMHSLNLEEDVEKLIRESKCEN
ncbi:HNH endonuclease [Anaeromicrobium sediminis]|uniref:Restriction endonuclease n=1 Tax=Anaeromicrobium sediminis TaxID=1478221 RepID=A0A267MR05_9FIRM|nr:HNH endonuclease signature motif containing protein [Anaeromicrobium sediminis]PAB61355.1 restriction endonuclease [Anaeromicrobium sediminis]